MDRKAVARETLEIMKKGYYEVEGRRIEIGEQQEHSVKNSFLLTPEQGEELLDAYGESAGNAPSKQALSHAMPDCTRAQAVPAQNVLAHTASEQAVLVQSAPAKTALSHTAIAVWNCPAVEAVLRLAAEGKGAAVLNFASAKNPGGGFINGAMAQEESLAASSCLYKTLTAHEDYYKNNRLCKSMMYTNHAIYSPDVVFFRDGGFQLLAESVTASVLTLPAVNMGQVMQKGEDTGQAKRVMKRRMKLALAIFAAQKCRHLVLGAYGCGVFRNDPVQIAAWWKELLEEFFPDAFESVVFAVLDHSSSQSCIRAFQELF